VASPVWAVALASPLLASACGWLAFAPRSIADCPGEIRSTEQIAGDFTLRQRVAVSAEDLAFPFELIVQKKGRELVLVGLSPLGAKLFTVTQTGLETKVDALPSAALPVPPLNVLRDLYRLQLVDAREAMEGRQRLVFYNEACHYTIRFEALSAELLPQAADDRQP
jgi:hypothetical protein